MKYILNIFLLSIFFNSCQVIRNNGKLDNEIDYFNKSYISLSENSKEIILFKVDKNYVYIDYIANTKVNLEEKEFSIVKKHKEINKSCIYFTYKLRQIEFVDYGETSSKVYKVNMKSKYLSSDSLVFERYYKWEFNDSISDLSELVFYPQ